MLTKIRLRSVWLIVPLYLVFARPTPTTIAVGIGFALLGGLMRAWAAGTIRKNKVLATHGAYALTRNPLYFGTFLIGLGFAIASGRISFLVFFLVFFLVIYGKTMRKEERRLEGLFGREFSRYADEVPLFFPDLTRIGHIGSGSAEPAEQVGGEGAGGLAVAAPPTRRISAAPPFELRRYIANREYQALLGMCVMFLLLAAKLTL